MSLPFILTDLKQQVHCFFVQCTQRECILVPDKAAIVSKLSDCVHHIGSELLVVVETTLDQLSRCLQRDLPSAVSYHLIE